MIHSRANAKLKELRRLKRSGGDTALLEGPHLIQEALSSGIELLFVLATPDFLSRKDAHPLVRSLPYSPLEVEDRLLDEIADADSPKGIVAAAHLPRGRVSGLPILAGVILYLDGIQDPGNLGALARTAEAASCVALALSRGCAHPNHPRALRASAGSLLRIPLAVEVAPQELNRHLSGLAPPWVALDSAAGIDIYHTELPESLILAVGAEGPGLSAPVRERADVVVRIPIAAPVESLNATVAAAVALFELQRRQNEAVPISR